MTDAKEYLSEIRNKRTQLERYKERRAALHIDVSFGGVDYSADRIRTTPRNKLEDAMIKLSERLAFLDRKIMELTVEIDDRINSIETLSSGAYRAILYKHYVEFRSFEVISVEMGYTYNYTCTLHGKALEELNKLLN